MPCSNIRASRNVRLFKPPTKLSPAASSLTASVIWAKWTRRKDTSLWLFLVQPLRASGEIHVRDGRERQGARHFTGRAHQRKEGGQTDLGPPTFDEFYAIVADVRQQKWDAEAQATAPSSWSLWASLARAKPK